MNTNTKTDFKTSPISTNFRLYHSEHNLEIMFKLKFQCNLWTSKTKALEHTFTPSSPIAFPERVRVLSTMFDCRTPSNAFSPSPVNPLAEKFTSSTIWKGQHRNVLVHCSWSQNSTPRINLSKRSTPKTN